RAHDLWLATQGVGVLYPLARSMGLADLTSSEQLAIGRRHSPLAVVSAQLVNTRIEGHVAALKSVEGERAADHRRAEGRFDLEQGCECQRRRHLCSVQKRQPFFRAELGSLDARLRQAFRRRTDLPTVRADLAEADQGQREMCKGSKIARCSHRALRRHTRVQLLVDELLQEVRQLLAHTRETAAET